MKAFLHNLNTRGIRFRLLLPWFLLLLLVSALIGFEFLERKVLGDLKKHADLHQQAVILSRTLQVETMARWTNARRYQHNNSERLRREVLQADSRIREKMESLSLLFAGETHHSLFPSAGVEADSRLENFRIARDGLDDLYLQMVVAVDEEDLDYEEHLSRLIISKLELVQSSLSDLAVFHAKAADLSGAEERLVSIRLETVHSALLFVVVALGLLFSYLQTRSVSTPLIRLTRVSERIAAGEDIRSYTVEGYSEIEHLSEAFAEMVASLRRATDQVEVRNRELEEKKQHLAMAYDEIELKVRERTRDLARRSAELEVANRDLESFSYSVSHDLRAPLRAIDGFLAILQEDHASGLDDEGIRLFSVVQQNARKMGQLIDDILSLSRAGRMELNRVEVDMQSLVRQIWAELKSRISDDRRIEFDLQELSPCVADPRAIRQVCRNLLENALKFTRDKETARIRVSSQKSDDWVWYEISDNGAGFNADYSEKLFSLFQRLHGMDEFEGTGVGLAIVKRLIQMHSGRVEAQGKPGQGAVFRFAIPRAPDNGYAADNSAVASSQPDNPSVTH